MSAGRLVVCPTPIGNLEDVTLRVLRELDEADLVLAEDTRHTRRLLERHGIDPEEVAPVNEAFSAGDIERALDLTPDAVADRIMVAGTPDDWVQWLTEVYAPIGLNHALLSFTDPFTLKAWAHLEVPGVPDLVQQVRLFGEHVLPRLP